MENANVCKMPMNSGSDLNSLPVFNTPDKIVAHAYAALIGELFYIAINTVPQLSYSKRCLTRYMSKATLALLTYARCCRVILLASSLSKFWAFSDSSWAVDNNNRRSSMAYYLFVNNATFS